MQPVLLSYSGTSEGSCFFPGWTCAGSTFGSASSSTCDVN